MFQASGSRTKSHPPQGFGGGQPPKSLRHSSAGQREVPGHPQQVHGDPRHGVLRDAEAAGGAGLREEPRAAAAARVPAAAAEGEGGRPSRSLPRPLVKQALRNEL